MSNKRNKYIALMISLIMLFEFVPLSVFSEETVVVDKSESQTVPVLLDPEDGTSDEEEFWEEVISEHIDDYTVTVTVTKEAEFPIGTTVTITPLSSGAYRNEAANVFDQNDNKLGSFIRVFDITFWYDDMEIEPLVPVDVKVTFDNAVELEGNNELKLIHLHEDEEAKEITAETETTETEDSEAIESLSFQSDKFSTYIVAEEIVVYTFSESGNNYEVVLKVNSAMGIPEDAVFTVDEITKDSDLYDQYAAQVAAVINPEGGVKMPALLDISLKTADGEKIQLDNKVQVIVRLTDEDVKRGLQVVHFPGEDPFQGESAVRDAVQSSNESDEIEVLNIESERLYPRLNTSENTVTFNTDSFSVFALAYKLVTYYTAASGETYKITLGYDETSGIPTDSELKVAEILPGDARYSEYFVQSLQAATNNNEETPVEGEAEGTTEHTISEGQYARFFDIEIWNQNAKIEPTGKVKVTIELADLPANTGEEPLKVIHFASEGTEIVQAKINTESIQFETKSFSVYGVIRFAAQPQGGVSGLDARSFTMELNGRYVKSNIVQQNNHPDKLDKTYNSAEAAVWHFEAVDQQNGKYYIYTIVNNEKQYLSLQRKYEEAANMILGDTPQVFTVSKNGDKYVFSAVNENTSQTYYLNEWNGQRGNGFAGYYTRNPNGDSFTLHFLEESIQNNKQYMVLVHYGDKYYQVNNDTTLTEVEYDPQTLKVRTDNPMLWTYDTSNGQNHLYFNTEAVGFLSDKRASDYYRRYLDPASSTGYTEEEFKDLEVIDTWSDQYGNNAPWWDAEEHKTQYPYKVTRRKLLDATRFSQYEGHFWHGDGGDWNNGQYFGVETDENGIPTKLAGDQSGDKAVNILFAEATNVLPSGTNNHSVNHIDISISGDSKVNVPLAYGTYYYKDSNGQWQEYSVTSVTTLKLEIPDVSITPEDMKHATIKAYDKKHNELDDAFTITGYSSNAHTNISTVQVRIEGNFKVADLDYTGGNDSRTKADRLENPITYVVSATKNLDFDMVDPSRGQLYEKQANGTYKPLSVNIDVDMTASFSYFDVKNQCPPLQPDWDNWQSYNLWQSGGIPTHGGTGMDFTLGGDAEQADANVVAIEITKLIVDESGMLIHPKQTIVNNMEIYEREGANTNSTAANSVSGLNVGKYESDADYSEYSMVHTKSISVGTSGMGLVYDYAVKPGLVYIKEKNDDQSLPKTFKDTAGNTWTYKETYITTEYVRRGDQYESSANPMHYSKTYTSKSESYNSIPEVLGTFQPISGSVKKSSFLEFFVYNVYTSDNTTSLEVEKKWANDKIPENAEVVFELFFSKRQITDKDGNAITPQDWDDNTYIKVKDDTDSIFDPKLNTTLTLKTNSADNLNWKGIFTGLPKVWKTSDGDYELDYLAKETVVRVNDEDVTDQYNAVTEKTQPVSGETGKDGKVIITNEEKDVHVKLRKRDTSSMEPVPGAKFKLYKEGDYPSGKPIIPNKNLCDLNNMGVPEKDENEEYTILVSGSNGNFYDGKLAPGKYYLVEVEAPTGYQILETPTIIEILDAKKEKGYKGVKVTYADGQIEYATMTTDKMDPPTDFFYNVYIKNVPVSKTSLTIQKVWVGGEKPEEIRLILRKHKKNIESTQAGGGDGAQQLPANTGVLEIEKKGLPSNPSGFAASYTVTNGAGYSETIQYSSFSNGKYILSDLAPGEYTVVETVTGVVPGYTMNSLSESSQTKTVSNNSTSSVTFTGSYTLTPAPQPSEMVQVSIYYGNYKADTLLKETRVVKGSTVEVRVTSHDGYDGARTWTDGYSFDYGFTPVDLHSSRDIRTDYYNSQSYNLTEYVFRVVVTQNINIGVSVRDNSGGNAPTAVEASYKVYPPTSSKRIINPYRLIASNSISDTVFSGISIPEDYVYNAAEDQIIILNNGNEWKQTIDVDQADSEDNVYYYEILEPNVPTDYEVSYTNKIVRADSTAAMTMTATNTYQKAKISVTKEDIIDENDNPIEADNTYTFIIKKDNVQVGEPLTVQKGQTATTDWLDFGTYTIEETETGRSIDGYSFNRIEMISGGQILTNPGTITLSSPTTASVTATNYYDIHVEPITVSVSKAWLTGEGNKWPKNDQDEYDPASVTVQLQIRNAGSSDVYTNIPDMTRVITPDENGDSTIVLFEDLDPGFEYNVVEATEVDDYEATVTRFENAFLVTNKYVPKVNIEASKKWVDIPADEQPSAIKFELFIEGSDIPVANSERIIVKDEGETATEDGKTVITWSGKAEWTGLKKYVDEDAETPETISYIPKETGVYFGTLEYGHEPVWIDPATYYTVDGGILTFDEAGKNGSILISNTPQYIAIPVEKQWDGYGEGYTWTIRAQLTSDQVEDVIGTVEREDVIDTIEFYQNTDEDGRTFKNLPKYCGDQEIQYTVSETYFELRDSNEELVACSDDDSGTMFSTTILPGEPDTDGNFKVIIRNSKKGNKLIINKEWIDVFDIETLPAIKFKLMYYPIAHGNDVQNANMGYQREYDGKEYVLDQNNNWTMEFEDLPTQIDAEDVAYYAEEVTELKDIPGGRELCAIYDAYGQLTDYQKQHFNIVLDSYKNSFSDYLAPADEPYRVAIQPDGEGHVSGTITIRNTCPGQYMQMDIKKKILEYDPNDGALWTTTSFASRKDSLVMEIQLYRRIVEDEPITIGGYKVTSGTVHPLTGFKEYGYSMLIGYKPGGEPVAVNDSRNPFEIRAEKSEGDWHWTISNTLQNTGLPRYGFYEEKAVRYQYLVVEKNAYTDTDKLTALNYVAILPAVWDAIDSGTGGQILMFDQDIAQDPDRIVNIKSANLEIQKVWNGPASAQQVYVKIYRTYNGDFDVGLTEDYTNMLNASFDEWLFNNLDKKAGILSSDHIYTPTGSSEKYIVLKGNETITIQNIPTVCKNGAYRYWIEEVGYKDSTGDHFYKTGINTYDASVQELVPYTTDYAVNSGANKKPFNNDNRAGAKTPVIFLDGTNHFTITNTPDKGALQIIKAVTAGNETDAVGKNFEFTVTLTIPSGKTLASTDLTISGGTIQNDFVLSGNTATFTVAITGAGTATIGGIPFETSYTVVEKTPLPTGWRQVGDPVYSDTGTPKKVATTDTTIDTVTITNEQVTSKYATKTWNGDENDKNLRPESITFTLVATVSGTALTPEQLTAEEITTIERPASVTIDAPTETDAAWSTASWQNLPKYTKSGLPIVYTITEAPVQYYTSSSAPDASDTTGNTTAFTNTLNKTNLRIVKVKAGTEEQLNGAVFQLKREVPKADTDPVVMEYVDYRSPITVNGTETIENLPDGNYQLFETQPPAGYYGLSAPISFTITDGVVQEPDLTGTTIQYQAKDGGTPATLTVENTPGTELPATGGRGTALYTFLGLMIILLAGGLLVYNKRRNSRENK